MEQNNPSTSSGRASARDFFLNLGAIVALYTVVVSLLNLLFRVINVAFPQTLNTYSYFGSQSISMPVATLIIFFPIYILLMWVLEKGYKVEPEKKQLAVRRWLSYITLFIAGLALAGDLVTVLYYFIDGQELTSGFLLKVLSVFVVALMVFMYYISDIRNRLNPKSQKLWLGVSLIIILASIIWGFAFLGSPRTQRLIKYDNQKISDLQNLQYQVINYWQVNGMVPEKWTDTMLDIQTGRPYEYKKTGSMTFELCAEFNKGSMMNQNQYPAIRDASYPVKGGMMSNDNWQHDMGRKCFERLIDPIAYPTKVRG